MRLKRKISPETENSWLDVTNKNYDLRNVSILKRKRNFTDHYGSDSRSTLAPKKLELIPDSISEEKTLSGHLINARDKFAKILLGELYSFNLFDSWSQKSL